MQNEKNNRFVPMFSFVWQLNFFFQFLELLVNKIDYSDKTANSEANDYKYLMVH